LPIPPFAFHPVYHLLFSQLIICCAAGIKCIVLTEEKRREL